MNTRSVALVTGAAYGIGQGVALRLAEDGYDLAVCAEVPCEETAEQVHARGAAVLATVADFTVPARAADLVRDTSAHFGRLDVLVNNAGVTLNRPASPSTPPPRAGSSR